LFDGVAACSGMVQLHLHCDIEGRHEQHPNGGGEKDLK
jgi:hypothetical protein